MVFKLNEKSSRHTVALVMYSMKQIQPVTAAVASASAAAVANYDYYDDADSDENADVADDGDGDDAAQRLTVVADDGEDHEDAEGAVGGEVADPFGISVDLRSTLHEVLLSKALVLAELLKTAYENKFLFLSKTIKGCLSNS